jgi:hypothetical protein
MMTMDDRVFAMQYTKDWCIGAIERLTKKLENIPMPIS